MQEVIISEASWDQDPYLNIALDEAIQRNLRDSAVLRFWKNDNAVVIGRFQCPFAEIDQDACSRLGTKVIRRHTGGGAVYHDLKNLNISFALRKKSNLFDNFQFMRKRFITAIVSALETVSVGPYLTNENSIFTETGRKLCGIAGSMEKLGYLIHASLLVSSDLKRLRSVLASDYRAPTGFVASQHSNVTSLENEAKHPLSMDQLSRLIASKITTAFQLRKSCETLKQSIVNEARKLADTKYRKAAWLLEPCMAQNSPCTRVALNGSVREALLENVNALFVRP